MAADAASTLMVNCVEAQLAAALNNSTLPRAAEPTQAAAEPHESLLAASRRIGVADTDLLRASAAVLGVSFVEDLRALRPCPAFVRRFSINFAREHGIIALLTESDDLIIVLPGPEAWALLDTVGRVLGVRAHPVFAPATKFCAANAVYEQERSQPDVILDSIGTDDAAAKLKQLEARDDLLATDGQAPVVELVNLILLDAVKGAASDIHFQPYREQLVVRYRIDGVLFDAHTVPKTLQDEVLSRIKVLGKMDIAEKRLPQDGRRDGDRG